MNNILFNLKTTVLLIVVAEFLKNFLCDKKYKKYIGICVNLFVFSYLLLQISSFDFKEYDVYSDNYTYDAADYENKIKEEYEKNVSKGLIEKYRQNNIFSVSDVITEADEKYNIVSLKIYVDKETKENEIKKIIAVTEGAGMESYEIIKASG